MSRPLFSILHSSARPHQWRKVYDAWISAAAHPELVEYVLCVDERWGFREAQGFAESVNEIQHPGEVAGKSPLSVVWNEGRRCYVDGVNTAAKASTGRILIVNADDQYPCEHWDEKVTEAVQQFPALEPEYKADYREFVIEVSTGTPAEHDRGILVMPILSRARYERLGYVLYPEYESMYADNEFCEHAKQDHCIIDARHLFFPHRHAGIDPESATWKKQAQVDEQYLEQNRAEAYAIGESVLKFRRKIRFGQVLDEAEQIQGWMTREELEWLARAAYESGSVIEIGCWKGRSTTAIANACEGPVHCVDTWEGSEELPEMQKQARHGAVFQEFKRNIGGKVTMHVGDSVTQAAGLPEVGMVFFDGCHTYEHLKAELAAYVGKATKLVCGHDFQDVQVRSAVRELLGDVKAFGNLWFYPIPKDCKFEVKQPAATQRVIALCLSGEHFHWEWVQALLRLHTYLGTKNFLVWTAREYTSNVYVTREQIRKVMIAQEPRPDLFLWLDDDNPAPTPEQFDLLLKDLDENPEVDGVTAWCYIYNTDNGTFYPSCGTWSPDGLHWRAFDPVFFPHEQKPRPVETTGFPCFLMRRSALEKAGDRPFLPVLDDRFEQGLSGEDLAFCMRAQAGGAKFLVEPRVRVRHLKTSDAIPSVPQPSDLTEVKIAVMMRVKNEARWIERCVNSYIALAGENVFVMDDESTDGTLEILQRLGVNVYRDPFAGEPLDETRDKDWLLSQVKAACDPDWILCVDGDEELEPDGPEMIRRVLSANPRADVFCLGFLFLWDRVDQFRIDGRYSGIARESLFRAKAGIHFKSYYEARDGADPKCHVGLHCGNAPVSVGRKSSLAVNLLHYGYLFREDRVRKYRWYRQIDPENPWEDNYQHMVIGDLPELPADAVTKFGGPLKLSKLTSRMVPQFDHELKPLPDYNQIAAEVFKPVKRPELDEVLL